MNQLIIESQKEREIIDITQRIQQEVNKLSIKSGFVHLFVPHTTTAITASYIDPDIEIDLIDAFEVGLPKLTTMRDEFTHSHHIAHLPSHVTAAYFGPSLSIPVEKGKLVLGDYQRIILVELNGPRKRKIIIGK